jgi:hypothetical protein
MQPRESIKAISYLDKSVSKNTRRQTKGLTRGFVCQSSKSPPHDRYVQAGSLSTAFLTPLALASFLTEVKQTFTNFPMTHHNLGSSRATPSHLGGFTSKSNKCHEDCFTKLKCSQRGSHSTLTWIFHKSHKTYKEV